MPRTLTAHECDLDSFVPPGLIAGDDLQRELPQIAKNSVAMSQITEAIAQIPTTHRLQQGDARDLHMVSDESVHLVITSPPYWTLKKYNESQNQLGEIREYDEFLDQLDQRIDFGVAFRLPWWPTL